MATGRPPDGKLSCYPLSVAYWKEVRPTQSGKTFDSYSVRLSRSYKDRDGKWQETTNLNLDDLPKAAALLSELFGVLAIKEPKQAPAVGGRPSLEIPEEETPF